MIVRGGGGKGIDFLMFLKNLTVYLTSGMVGSRYSSHVIKKRFLSI